MISKGLEVLKDKLEDFFIDDKNILELCLQNF